MRWMLLVLFLCAVLAPSAVAADADFETAAQAIDVLSKELEKEGRSPWHNFTIGGSVMLVMDFDTSIRVDLNEVDRGTEIHLEDLLGLDDRQTLWRIDFAWRPSRSHMLALSYFDIRRQGERQIRKDVTIGDEEFTSGANVDTELNTRITKFNYWWNCLTGESWEVGVGLGIYWMAIDASFTGALQAPNLSGDFSVDESVRVDFPPPLIGLRGAWAITDRLRLSSSAEILYVPVEEFEGWIFDFHLGLQWDLLDFAGVSVGYNFFDMGVEAHYSRFDGVVDYRFHGLMGGIYFYF